MEPRAKAKAAPANLTLSSAAGSDLANILVDLPWLEIVGMVVHLGVTELLLGTGPLVMDGADCPWRKGAQRFHGCVFHSEKVVDI